MKFLLAAIAGVLLSSAAIAHAQNQPQMEEGDPKTSSEKLSAVEPEISLGQLTPTPEMWFYEQAMRRYRDPKVSVRRRAEFEADQRQARLAAQRWFGYSNSRPTVNPTPFTSTYSPMWTSNSPYSGQWRGVGHTTVVVPAQAGRPSTGYGLW
jgi:hypothetical protein